jgi:hypothetical protein
VRTLHGAMGQGDHLMGKSTINYNNPLRTWGLWWSQSPYASGDGLIEMLMQNHERDQANRRIAEYRFEDAWPPDRAYKPWWGEPNPEKFPGVREEFRKMFVRFWRESI